MSDDDFMRMAEQFVAELPKKKRYSKGRRLHGKKRSLSAVKALASAICGTFDQKPPRKA